jgi:hypothetical protein
MYKLQEIRAFVIPEKIEGRFLILRSFIIIETSICIRGVFPLLSYVILTRNNVKE